MQLHTSHHARWMRGLLYCGHCGCDSIQRQTLRGLASPCKMNSRSKYAVDTRRMIVTGNVRQGVSHWPLDKNFPGNELLGRYDMYPHPNGREGMAASSLEVTSPPTTAPSHLVVPTQPGFATPRLRIKTNRSGADEYDSKGSKMKDKVRDLRLRFQQTGSTRRNRVSQGPIQRKPAKSVGESTVLTDDQALELYLGESATDMRSNRLPGLTRLSQKTKAPPG